MAECNRSEIGERIKNARKRFLPKCSKEVVAEVCGVARGTWSRYERGELPINAEVLKVFCQWTGTSADYLLMGDAGYKSVSVVNQISAEVERAAKKFPTWPTDPLHALAVLGEEYGELTKAMLQLTYEPYKTNHAEVRSEAIQTAAMAIRLAMSLDRYEYQRCPQHTQD